MRKFWQELRELPYIIVLLKNYICGSEAERNEKAEDAYD